MAAHLTRVFATARHPAPHGRWSLRSSWGELAFGLLAIAVLSGFALVIPFDIRRAYDSLAWMLLTNPAGAFFRNLHYWAGQLFLLLTLAHTWDHLRRSTELRLRPAVWLRVALSLPLAVFVMLSGFLLKGDAESQQAIRILSASLETIPLAGRALSLFLLGAEGNRQLLYVQHVGTASLLVWLFVAEHARAVWPRRVAVIEAFLACTCLALFLTPSLHDGLDPVVKGPWYFLGLQEILHWATRPGLVVAGAAALLAWWLLLPRLSDRWARASKWLLALGVIAYAGLTVVGVFFRGEAWAWGFSPGHGSYGITAHGVGAWWGAPIELLEKHRVPLVLGRREGCLFCHSGIRGLSASHAADAVGCASCHGGNPFSLHAPTAHAGMILVPGNLDTADRSCGTPSCHPAIVPRVRASLMNTMAGIIEVDRDVWSFDSAASRPRSGWLARNDNRELRSPKTENEKRKTDVRDLGHTGADGHLRQLCASCHVGAEKTDWGPVGELTRGGGCNACHLTYSEEALRDLRAWRQRKTENEKRNKENAVPLLAVTTHPGVSLGISRAHCFGCHSRSGRISTSYEGWMETELAAAPAAGRYRTLEDGRVFQYVQVDIHAEKGMECVDCHTSREVMGDGARHARKGDAVRVRCEDCHIANDAGLKPRAATLILPRQGSAPAAPRTVTGVQLDAESKKIATLRGRGQPDARFLVSDAGPLLNTSLDADGRPWLTTKSAGRRLELRAPAPVCVEGQGHARLSCISCHAAWAPRCTRCHTRFDPSAEGVDLLDGTHVRGSWVETAGGFSATPPTLGVRTLDTGLKPRGTTDSIIDTFIPGMIITLDRNETAGGKPDHVFRRLYARAFSHTISKGGRSCRSCHNDPVALGYGEGTLTYERVAETTGAAATATRLSAENGKRKTEKGKGRTTDAITEEGDRRKENALPRRSPQGAKAGVWRFVPAEPPGPDGLPGGAWVGFLRERTTGASTRPDVRPFSVDEQKRILTVGACLTCHEPSSPPMRSAVANWKATVARVSPRCVIPRW